jgi:hypothetical protein
MGLCGGVGGFASGFIKKAWGFHILSNLGSFVILALVVVALRHVRARHPMGIVAG